MKILMLFIIILVCGLVTSCTNVLSKPGYEYGSLNSIPATVTEAWDNKDSIYICIQLSKRKNMGSDDNYQVAIKAPNPWWYQDYEYDFLKTKFIFTDNYFNYEANMGESRLCDNLKKLKYPKVPIFLAHEMATDDFSKNNPEAIYYQLTDGRISSLGYFSVKPMFQKYYNMNIDLTNTKTVIGIKDRGLIEAIFVPLSATLNVIAGSVVFGATAIACGVEGGCK